MRKKRLDYIVIRLEHRFHIRPRVPTLRVFFMLGGFVTRCEFREQIFSSSSVVKKIAIPMPLGAIMLTLFLMAFVLHL
jgi:hypothetical protein